MPKANFAVITFNEHLGDNVRDLRTPPASGRDNFVVGRVIVHWRERD